MSWPGYLGTTARLCYGFKRCRLSKAQHFCVDFNGFNHHLDVHIIPGLYWAQLKGSKASVSLVARAFRFIGLFRAFVYEEASSSLLGIC